MNDLGFSCVSGSSRCLPATAVPGCCSDSITDTEFAELPSAIVPPAVAHSEDVLTAIATQLRQPSPRCDVCFVRDSQQSVAAVIHCHPQRKHARLAGHSTTGATATIANFTVPIAFSAGHTATELLIAMAGRPWQHGFNAT